jgi:hypothetical protein
MEEGCQKCKRLSYKAEFKLEVVWCAEKRNCKATAIFGVEESNVQLWQKFKREVVSCTVEKGNRKAPAIFGVDESKI